MNLKLENKSVYWTTAISHGVPFTKLLFIPNFFYTKDSLNIFISQDQI